MAIIKQKTNSQGISYEYWVLQGIPNIITKKTQIVMCGFVNKDVRNSGASFIERINLGEMEGIYLTGEEMYTWAKQSRMENELETNPLVNAIDEI